MLTRGLAKLALLVAVLLASLMLSGAATAQDLPEQQASVVVAAVNTLSIASGTSVTFDTADGAGAANSETVLEYSTNNGSLYRIVVRAESGGWVFTPQVPGNSASSYPLLTFVSASATAGTGGTASTVLISSDNSATVGAEVVTGVRSAAGRATVTLSATATTEVVAGVYRTGLTYSLSTP